MASGQEVDLIEKSEYCIYHSTKEKKHLQCYKEIQYKNISYKGMEFVIIRGSENKELARIVCFFIDELLNFRAVIVRYIFARHCKTLLKSSGLSFDENNEVIQDVTKYYIIDLMSIIKKCNIIVLTLEDDIHFIKNANMDVNSNFSLRFTIKSNKLYPLLPDANSIESELYIKSVTTEVEMINIDSSEDEVGAKALSPRRRVKRNLNSSFADIENYTLVSSDDDTGPLTIKLRKSSRNVPRKSYTDYQSPKKTSKMLEDQDFNQPKDSPTKKLLQEIGNLKLESPTKKTGLQPSLINYTPRRSQRIKRSFANNHLVGSPNNLKKTPRHGRRHASIKNSDSDSDYTLKSPPKKANITPKKKLSTTPISPRSSRRTKEDLSGEDHEPSAETGHDDSLRTRMLKIKLENLYLDEDDSKQDKPSTRQKISKTKMVTDLTSSSESTNDSDLPPQQFLVSPPSDKSALSSGSGKPKNPKTAQTPKTSKTPKTPKTSRSAIKLIREGDISPSMQLMFSPSKPISTPFLRVRTELHVSHVPKSLPCREQEYRDIHQFLEATLSDRIGGCMYISGVPGTGKTATVTSVINNLQKDKSIPHFTFININAMRLSEPRQTYVEIFKQLEGKVTLWEQAQTSLEHKFLKNKSKKPIVIVVDELDVLCTKRQDVVYNLLDWPSKAKTPLIVITIANTMDLPERLLMNKVSSRLGLTRLTFQAYTYQQLQQIITKRLTGIVGFNPDAIQYVARKVASVSGDARRALDICRRAVEIAESKRKGTLKLDMQHVSEALESMITQPKVQAIKFCSKLEQLILKSIVAEVERTGIEETTFLDVYKMLVSVCALDGYTMFSQTNALAAVSKLGSSRLIITDQKCNNIHQRIVLNVSVDDVYYALQKQINVNDIVLEPLGEVDNTKY